MYRSIVLLLAAVSAAGVAEAAKTYEWVDESGVTHFSTSPPPSENADRTTLQGGSLTRPRTDTEPRQQAGIKRKDLTNSGWQGCNSSLCQLVKKIDPDCATSFCSRAKRYSAECSSVTCQTKKLTLEREMQDRLAAQNELRRPQSIDAGATPTAPASQNQD